MPRPNRRQFGALALVLCSISSQWEPEAAAQSPPPETSSEIARFLVSQGTVVTVPAEGRVNRSIAKEAPTFALPDGASSVMLLELPDYFGPYDLAVVSFRRGIGLTTEIFVPSGFYFDAEFQQVGAFGEEQLEVTRQSLLGNSGIGDVLGVNGVADSLVATFTFGEANRAVRYLLLYTQGDLVGQQTSYGWRAVRVERSLEASIAVATSPLPAQSEVARSFQQLQALVEVGDRIRVGSGPSSGPGQTVQGRIVALSSSLVLLANDAEIDLQEDDVSFIEQRGDSLWNGARSGLWVGSIVGVACALFCVDVCIDINSDAECPPPGPPRTDGERWGIFLGTAAVGAGVGAAIDWARRGWTLVYERPTRPTATATLSPIISANNAGVRLTVGF